MQITNEKVGIKKNNVDIPMKNLSDELNIFYWNVTENRITG